MPRLLIHFQLTIKVQNILSYIVYRNIANIPTDVSNSFYTCVVDQRNYDLFSSLSTFDVEIMINNIAKL